MITEKPLRGRPGIDPDRVHGVIQMMMAQVPITDIVERTGISKTKIYEIRRFVTTTKENAPASTKGPGRDQTQENAGVSPQQDTSGETTTTNGGTQ